MTLFFRTRFRRCVPASAVVLLALAAITVSALSISSPLAQARLPKTVASQAVSSCNDDLLFRHGVQAWPEQGCDGMTSAGDPLSVGVIDTGFDRWRMSARHGLLPEPPNPDNDVASSNSHGTSVAQVRMLRCNGKTTIVAELPAFSRRSSKSCVAKSPR